MVGMSSMPGTRHFDIALFGSTASVYMLAACLARNGIGVALFQTVRQSPIPRGGDDSLYLDDLRTGR